MRETLRSCVDAVACDKVQPTISFRGMIRPRGSLHPTSNERENILDARKRKRGSKRERNLDGTLYRRFNAGAFRFPRYRRLRERSRDVVAYANAGQACNTVEARVSSKDANARPTQPTGKKRRGGTTDRWTARDIERRREREARARGLSLGTGTRVCVCVWHRATWADLILDRYYYRISPSH